MPDRLILQQENSDIALCFSAYPILLYSVQHDRKGLAMALGSYAEDDFVLG